MTICKNLSTALLAFSVSIALSSCAENSVRETCGAGCSADAKITADVQAAIDQHPVLLPPDMIDVQTIDHVVYLDGLTDTGREKRLAASVVSNVPGVDRVVNSIAVRGD